MRFVVTLIIVCCSLLALSGQNAKNVLAYYVADSILPYMPLHKAHQDSLASYKRQADSTAASMYLLIMTRRDGDPQGDTTHDSALLKSLRKEQQDQLDSNQREYKRLVVIEMHIIDSIFRTEEIAEIQKSVDKVAKQKHYKKIYEHAEAEIMRPNSPSGTQPVDVTELVMKEMKLK